MLHVFLSSAKGCNLLRLQPFNKMIWVSKVSNYDAYGLFRALHSHNPFYAPLRSVLNMCHWHIAPWHHVMYRKKELAVCSASSFKQKIKSAEGGT